MQPLSARPAAIRVLLKRRGGDHLPPDPTQGMQGRREPADTPCRGTVNMCPQLPHPAVLLGATLLDCLRAPLKGERRACRSGHLFAQRVLCWWLRDQRCLKGILWTRLTCTRPARVRTQCTGMVCLFWSVAYKEKQTMCTDKGLAAVHVWHCLNIYVVQHCIHIC